MGYTDRSSHNYVHTAHRRRAQFPPIPDFIELPTDCGRGPRSRHYSSAHANSAPGAAVTRDCLLAITPPPRAAAVRDPFRAFFLQSQETAKAQPALIKDVHVNITLDVPRFGHILATDRPSSPCRLADRPRRKRPAALGQR